MALKDHTQSILVHVKTRLGSPKICSKLMRLVETSFLFDQLSTRPLSRNYINKDTPKIKTLHKKAPLKLKISFCLD